MSLLIDIYLQSPEGPARRDLSTQYPPGGRSPQIYTVCQGVTMKNDLSPHPYCGKKSSASNYYVINLNQ